MSNSKSEFIPTDDGLKVFVEHGDFGPETMTFINGIANDVWHEEVSEDAEDKEIRQKQNPTLRWWKKRKPTKKPNLHLSKGRFRFVPPTSMCLLGPEPQYVTDGEGWTRNVLRRHPACACDRCTKYSYYDYHSGDAQTSRNFWDKITGRVNVEV